ncbi:hypothetical protein K1719_039169 [Acacia pycnantha]|nr:hypothetical protein K1719_039169 [Acacia pycnantha]
MAPSVLKLSSFIAFLCIALLVSSPTENVVEAACGKDRFIGTCSDGNQCNNACINVGGASGSCQPHGLGFICLCHYNCEK